MLPLKEVDFMTNFDDSWELFSKTGDINAYLMYKSALNTQNRSGDYGEHKDEGSDYKKL